MFVELRLLGKSEMIHRKVRIVKKEHTVIFLEMNDYGIKALKLKGKGVAKVYQIPLEKVQHIIDSLEKNKAVFTGGKLFFDKKYGAGDEKLVELLKTGKVVIA